MSQPENIFNMLTVVPKEMSGREVVVVHLGDKISLYLPPSGKWGGGRESKKVLINRFVSLDNFFFEGLGLWHGEGAKSKGIYFSNSNVHLICHFLKFVEEKLRISRADFNVTVCAPYSNDTDAIKKRWADALDIPVNNFTKICVDSRLNKENAQVYFNSILLVSVLKNLHENLKQVMTPNTDFAASYLRGIFAGEGSVLIRNDVLFHIDFAGADTSSIKFYKQCLDCLGITHGEYIRRSLKFQIYGHRNFKRFRELGIHTLHPEKREKFENGFASYKRVNVLDGEEARALILQQLASGPKTYDELAAALGKARTTIQAHHIPILERDGKIRRAGKRGQAWLLELAEPELPKTAIALFAGAAN